MGKTRGTSDGATTVVQSGDNVARIIAYGADGTDTESSLGAIQFDVDGTPGANDMPGRIVFSTTPDGAATYTERMRIDANGRVVIGHNAASTNYGKVLQIHNSAAAGASVHLTDSTTGTSNSDGFELVMHNQAAYLVQREPSSMIFMTNGTNERLRIMSGGNVNICLLYTSDAADE